MEKDPEGSGLRGHGEFCFGRHLVADTTAAVSSAAIIAPIITATDRSVVESVSTSSPLLRTLAKNLACPFTHPRRFFATKPVFVVWALYAATYLTANVAETLSDRYLAIDKALTGTVVSTAVFVVNTPLGVWKDVRFAQLFGPPRVGSGPAPGPRMRMSRSSRSSSRMPASATAAFLARDAITVFGSFALAPRVSALVPDPPGAAASQLLVPALTQVVATPVHLAALDMYARPGRRGAAARCRRATEKLASTTAVRALRLVPAFGLGVIFNKYVRSSLGAGGGGGGGGGGGP